jgi:adenylate cyclase
MERSLPWSPRTIRVVVIACAWTFIATVTYVDAYLLIGDLKSLGKLDGAYPFLPDFLGIALTGLTGGILGGYLLVYRLNSGRRHRSFMSDIVRAGWAFLLIYVGASAGLVFVMAFGLNAVDGGLVPALVAGWDNVVVNLASLSFVVTMVLWGLVVVGTQFMLQVNDKFGPGVLWKLITGRYYHPREEERVFMFLDLKASTAIAEELGHRRFFEFLREVYQDITAPVAEHGGEIYQYVGDEVVLVWTPQRASNDASAVRCFFAIEEALDARRDDYLGRFHVTPTFKAGVHVGSATVGEIGVLKKDIVYSGDVLNATARIQDECNRYRVSLLASADLLGMVPASEAFHAISIGELTLRGRSEPLSLSVVLPA